MKIGYKGHLTTRNKFSKSFFPIPKIFLLILDELKKPMFWANRGKFTKLRGLEP
jgi:hypothetical protein